MKWLRSTKQVREKNSNVFGEQTKKNHWKITLTISEYGMCR